MAWQNRRYSLNQQSLYQKEVCIPTQPSRKVRSYKIKTPAIFDIVHNADSKFYILHRSKKQESFFFPTMQPIRHDLFLILESNLDLEHCQNRPFFTTGRKLVKPNTVSPKDWTGKHDIFFCFCFSPDRNVSCCEVICQDNRTWTVLPKRSASKYFMTTPDAPARRGLPESVHC